MVWFGMTGAFIQPTGKPAAGSIIRAKRDLVMGESSL
jgi:hypothetical protein